MIIKVGDKVAVNDRSLLGREGMVTGISIGLSKSDPAGELSTKPFAISRLFLVTSSGSSLLKVRKAASNLSSSWLVGTVTSGKVAVGASVTGSVATGGGASAGPIFSLPIDSSRDLNCSRERFRSFAKLSISSSVYIYFALPKKLSKSLFNSFPIGGSPSLAPNPLRMATPPPSILVTSWL